MLGELQNSYPHYVLIRPRVEQTSIFKPVDELDWTYSHHAHITFFQGRYYAIWSNGRKNEDDTGQRVMIASSANFMQWTDPKPLLDSKMGTYGEWVFTAAGFHIDGDTLIAYIGQYEYDEAFLEGGVRRTNADAGHIHTDLLAMSSVDGQYWSEPVALGIPIVPNHGPQRISSGRLIISGNISYPYTDESGGLNGWKRTGIYGSELEQEVVDDSEYIHVLCKKMGWPTMLCEGSFFETDDGVLHMLLRSTERRLWVTRSVDQGASWSSPIPTSITDSNTKFHFGRLPDGRFYYVGSPVPDGKRNPLVVSVSDDGVKFDRHTILCEGQTARRFEGMHKGGDYGYPHSLVQDEYLYVIYSVTKEEVQAVRVPLAAL